MVDTVSESGDYDEEVQAVLRGGGPQTEIGYRIAWARTYLKGMGLLTNISSGTWSLTEAGVKIIETTDTAARDEEVERRHKDYTRSVHEKRGVVPSGKAEGPLSRVPAN